MAPLTGGLQPLIPYGSLTQQPEATAEERLGGPADPRHGQRLQERNPKYPWQRLRGVRQAPPSGEDVGLIGASEGYALPAGTMEQHPFADETPWTHRAPWPKGVIQSVQPDAVAEHLAWSAELHAVDSGASRRMHTTVAAQQDTWQEVWTVDAGTSLQSPNNGQIKQAVAGWGSTDRAANQERQNSHGFDSAHLHRRYATGSIPGNYLWMKPSGRPMHKTVPGPARPPVGDASPFTGQDLTRDYGVQGAVLQQAAVEYTPPAEPYIAPSYASSADPGPVAWW